jgi:hypothetical protein
LTTIYSELIEAAGAEFLPQAEGEPDGHYIRRLVLIVCSCTDEKWERLSKEAQDWYNAQALRVKAHQEPEHCPGFYGTHAQWEHEHKDDQVAFVDASVEQFASAGFDKGILEELKDQRKRVAHLAGLDNLPVTSEKQHAAMVDAIESVIDAGWPTGPELPKESSNDVAHQDSQAAVVREFETVIKDAFKPYASAKHTATDAVRAIVMQHQDWNQAQILRELEAQGRAVSLGTIATVRSMTLATIAVAKGLGKWVEG